MKNEFQILDDFIKSKALRRTPQRERVLDVFLSVEKHVSVDELYKLVKRRHPDIGYTTVYRTMRLLSETGLCNEVDFGDGILRYEHKYNHSHHDHLVCTECGCFIEVSQPQIEQLQDRLAKKHNFVPTDHRLHIYGVCKKCRQVPKKRKS
jgi:Fur family ferric uptake transcriptional regulator